MSLMLWRLAERPIQGAALLAGVLGLFSLPIGGFNIMHTESAGVALLSFVQIVVGLFLLPTAVGIVWRVSLARWAGVCLFGLSSLTSILMLVSFRSSLLLRSGWGFLTLYAALMLLFAGEEFESSSDERTVARRDYPGSR